MELKQGDNIWFIKHYYPKWPYRPFETYKVCRGVLKSIIPNVKIIASDRKTIIRTVTHYVIKGMPDCLFENVYITEDEALKEFKRLKEKYNWIEYYKC